MSPNSSTPLAQTPAAAASMGSTSGVQARDASTSHSSWGLTSLFRTLFTAGTRPSSSPSLPVLYGGIPTTLTFFDALLSMQCRRPVAVRVYSTESDKTGNSLGWAVVQQAFAALWDYSGNGLLHSASSADLTRVASSFGNGPATASAASIAAATAGATAMSTATHTAAGSGPWTAQPPQPPHASIAGHHEAGQGHMRNSWGDQGDQEEREGASLWWGTHRVSCMAVGGCSMAVTAGSTATAVTQYMWARMDPLTAPINRGGSQQLQRGGGRWVGGSTEGGASGLAGPAVRPSVMSLDKGKHKNMQGAGSSRDTSCHGAGAAGRLLGGTAAGPGSTAGTSTGAAAAIQAPVHHRAGMAQTHHSSYTSFASFPHVPSSIALPTFTQPLPNHRQTATNHPTAVAGSASTPGTAAAGTASSSYSSYLSPTKLWSAFANVAGPSKPGTDPPFHRPGESGAATAATAAAGAGAAAVAAVAGPAAPGAAGGASAVPWGQQPVGGPHHSSNWSNHNRDMRASYGNDHVTAGQAAVIGGSGWARGHDTGQAYASRTAPGKGEGEWVGTSGQVRGEHHGRNDSWGMEGGVVERKQVQVQVYDDHFSFLAALAGSGQQGGRQQLRSSWDGGAGAATPSLHGGSRGSRGHRSELKMRGQVSGASLGYGAAQQHSVATRPADARSPSTTHAQGDSWQVRGMSQPEQALVGVMMRDLGRPVTAASQHREAVTGLRRAPSMGCDAPASCSVAGLFLDDLADCGLAWEVQGWWAAAQEVCFTLHVSGVTYTRLFHVGHQAAYVLHVVRRVRQVWSCMSVDHHTQSSRFEWGRGFHRASCTHARPPRALSPPTDSAARSAHQAHDAHSPSCNSLPPERHFLWHFAGPGCRSAGPWFSTFQLGRPTLLHNHNSRTRSNNASRSTPTSCSGTPPCRSSWHPTAPFHHHNSPPIRYPWLASPITPGAIQAHGCLPALGHRRAAAERGRCGILGSSGAAPDRSTACSTGCTLLEGSHAP